MTRRSTLAIGLVGCTILAALALHEVLAKGAPAKVAKAATGPKDTIFNLRGLFLLDTDTGRAIFPNPGNSHPLTLMINTDELVNEPSIRPDMVLSGPMGSGRAVWTGFTGLKLKDNVMEKIRDVKKDKVNGAAPANDQQMRWVPSMSDVVDKPVLDADEVKKAVVATFHLGRLRPLFDRLGHLTECFNVGKRTCTALADGVTVRVKTKDPNQPLFAITKDGTNWADFVVTHGATIELTAFPTKKSSKHLEHFHELLHLLSGHPTIKDPEECKPCPNVTGAQPVPHPIRCAPSVFP